MIEVRFFVREVQLDTVTIRCTQIIRFPTPKLSTIKNLDLENSLVRHGTLCFRQSRKGLTFSVVKSELL